jgi:phosphonoacetate hydrolase
VYRVARSVVPSFTNPNNLSIVTGARRPSTEFGQLLLRSADRAGSHDERPKFLRCETLLRRCRARGQGRGRDRQGQAPAPAGPRHGRHLLFLEKADQTTKGEHGIERATDLVAMPVPSVYSAELSEYVLAAGLELLERERPDVMYPR